MELLKKSRKINELLQMSDKVDFLVIAQLLEQLLEAKVAILANTNEPIDENATVVPIFGRGERLGSLVIAKASGEVTNEDLILVEQAAVAIGFELLREREAVAQEEARKRLMVKIAFSTLSYSELEAIVNILGELEGNEGLLVASKIADRVGITRSVIVNALRKFESADLIETRSLGMKGTFIKVKNEFLFDELHKK